MTQGWVNTWIEAIQIHLQRIVPDSSHVLHHSMRYSLLADGKRIRPLLALATGRAFGVAEEKMLDAACALECIHAYSLIHDDLPCMDNDDLRRGKPTNHKVFGDAMALLAGDALQTAAFSCISRSTSFSAEIRIRMISLLAEAAGHQGMVLGQAADMEAEQQLGEMTMEKLRFIHTNKTGKLLQAAIEMGAIAAEVSDSQYHSLHHFACHLGLVFQMVDDWLDVVGDTAVMGKMAGSDQEHGKLTYPALIGIEATKQAIETEEQLALQSLHAIDADTSLLENLLFLVTRRNR
ncbi:polyprenyl synthetase family protein [Alicyclobacillus sp. TC]|uniref:polyprenyl synthetase family protein n=1 Tax=Alicyclobacillus sp. TC TaxID=2606450 RepID=UPI001934AB3C|nr:farnesyl diphosphate synthase [Alicyclobacillus sp. TC]